MNLQKLNHSIENYKSFLKAARRHDPYWKWESLQIFQENWNLEAPDLHSMFDRSLENSRTRRLWSREQYAPKKMMLSFIDMNPEYVRFMFQDLFNEQKEVEGRIGRFVFYCDELLRAFHENHPTSKENSHYHDDNYGMVSIYLAFRFPEEYAPYHFETFKNALELLGSRDVPKVNDTARYFKVMRTIFKFLQKDPEILSIHRNRMDPTIHYLGDTLLFSEDFCQFLIQ